MSILPRPDKNIRSLVSVALTGFATFFIQLVLLRHSLTTIAPNELTLGFFYGFWLFGMGTGAWLLRRGFPSLKIFLLYPSALLGVLLLTGARSFLSLGTTDHLSTKIILSLMAVSILPAALVAGSLIPSIGGKLKRLYISVEAFGALAAGFLYSFGPLSAISSLWALTLFAGPLLVFAGLLIQKRRHLLSAAIVLPLMLLLSLLSGLFSADRLHGQRLIHSFQGPEGKSLIFQDGRATFTLLRNGHLSEVYDGSCSPSFLELADMLATRGGTGPILLFGDVSTAVCLSKGLHRPIRLVTDAAPPLRRLALYGEGRLPKNLTIHEGEGFVSLVSSSSLVIITSNLPSTMKDARLLSVEFFTAVKKHLSPTGTLLLGIDLPGLHPSRPFLEAAAISRATLDAVYGSSSLLIEERTWLLAGLGTVPDLTPQALKAAGWVRLSSLLTAPKVLEDQLRPLGAYSPSSLSQPGILLASLMIHPGGPWPAYLQSIKHGEGRIFFVITPSTLPWILLALFVAGLLFSRRLRLPQKPGALFETGFILFFSGFTAMASQIALLNALQRGTGNILVDVGIVSGIFMATYALGSFSPYLRFSAAFRLGLSLAALAVFTLLFPLLVSMSSGRLIYLTLLSALSGFFTGAVVPISYELLGEAKKGLPLIFSMDNLGAGAGALIGGALLLPSLGPAALFTFLGILFTLLFMVRLVPEFLAARPSPARARTTSIPAQALTLSLFFLVAVGLSVWMPRGEKVQTTMEGARFVSSPFPYFLVHEGRARYKVKSSLLPSYVSRKGFAGPIETITTFCRRGTILSVEIGANRETPSFVERVKKWTGKFRGIKAQTDIYGPQGVDTISGATMSTAVVRDAVNESRNLLFKHVLHLKTKESTPKAGSVPVVPVVLVSLFLFAGLVVLFLPTRTGRILPSRLARLTLLIISVILMGIMYNLMLSSVDLGLFTINLPPTSVLKWLIFGFLFLSAILLGPIWCGFFCPLGALQELIYTVKRAAASLITRKTNLADSLSSSEDPLLKGNLFNGLSLLRYFILGVSITGFAYFGSQAWFSTDPLSFFYSLNWRHLYQIVLIAFLFFASLWFFRPHCRFLCPVGALITLLGVLAPLRRFLPLRRIKECDYGVRSLRDVSCIHCNRCQRPRS